MGNVIRKNKSGNPACNERVSGYLKAVQLKQTKSHVYIKQAKPLFLREI